MTCEKMPENWLHKIQILDLSTGTTRRLKDM